MPRRVLALRFYTACRSFVVGVDRPSPHSRVIGGAKWCDAHPGSKIQNAGAVWPILAVALEECEPPSEAGRLVWSGRAWLESGEAANYAKPEAARP